MFHRLFCVFALCVSCYPQLLSAAVVYVDIDKGVCPKVSNKVFCTISEALTNADDGDQIVISEGRFQENLFIKKSVKLEGIAGQRVHIDGSQSGPVIIVAPAISVDLTNITIENGKSDKGGGIYNQGKLTIKDAIIQGNLAELSGGGIYSGGSLSAQLDIENSIIQNNQSLGDDKYNVKYGGGGIYNDAPLKIVNSQLRNNVAIDNGGAVYSTYTKRRKVTSAEVFSEELGIAAKPNLRTILLREVDQQGVEMKAVKIEDNTAANGGGIYLLGGLNIRNSYIVENKALSYQFSSGGGIFAHFNASLRVSNTIMAANEATFRGGALRFYSTHDAQLFNTSITNNKVGEKGRGAGIFVQNQSKQLRLRNSLVANNTIAGAEEENCYGNLYSDGYNAINFNRRCQYHAEVGDVTAVLVQKPVYDRETGEYLPVANNPLLDAANPEGCIGPEGIPMATDVRGKSRTVDGNQDGIVRCDIGALEKQFP